MFGSNNILKKEIEAKNATIAELQKELDDYKHSLTSFSNQQAKYEADKKKIVDRYEAENAQLKKQIELEKKSVAKKVNAELSTIGVSQFLAEELSNEALQVSTPASIFRQFESMIPGSKEAMEYYNKHSKTIDAYRKQKI